jgi:hypothetical protein
MGGGPIQKIAIGLNVDEFLFIRTKENPIHEHAALVIASDGIASPAHPDFADLPCEQPVKKRYSIRTAYLEGCFRNIV